MITYPSQRTFAGGGCMCTSAAMYWAIACASRMIMPDCSPEKMRILMEVAAETQRAITLGLAQPSSYMLQQHEVLEAIQLPSNLQGVEMYGYCSDLPTDMPNYIHVSEVYSLLKNGDAMVITGGHHTTALYCTSDSVYAYDSSPACVSRIGSAAELTDALLSAHSNMVQFTVTALRERSRLNTPLYIKGSPARA